VWSVRANQGHTMEVEDLELKPIVASTVDPVPEGAVKFGGPEAPNAVHGTYMAAWSAISRQGLSRMKRNHIHMSRAEPEEGDVISGMRVNCEVAIYVNVDAAIKDGYQFLLSANNVILCTGNDKGFLPPKYFSRVLNRQTRKLMLDASRQ